MGLRVGDMVKWSHDDSMTYTVLAIDTSRPPKFHLDGRGYRQDVLWSQVPFPDAWAGNLDILNEQLESGGLIIVKRDCLLRIPKWIKPLEL
jgi:hypothetical protein